MENYITLQLGYKSSDDDLISAARAEFKRLGLIRHNQGFAPNIPTGITKKENINNYKNGIMEEIDIDEPTLDVYVGNLNHNRKEVMTFLFNGYSLEEISDETETSIQLVRSRKYFAICDFKRMKEGTYKKMGKRSHKKGNINYEQELMEDLGIDRATLYRYVDDLAKKRNQVMSRLLKGMSISDIALELDIKETNVSSTRYIAYMDMKDMKKGTYKKSKNKQEMVTI